MATTTQQFAFIEFMFDGICQNGAPDSRYLKVFVLWFFVVKIHGSIASVILADTTLPAFICNTRAFELSLPL